MLKSAYKIQAPENCLRNLFFFYYYYYYYFYFSEVDTFFSACFVCSVATCNENAKEYSIYGKSPNC